MYDQKQIENNFTKALVNLLDPGNLKGKIHDGKNQKRCKLLSKAILKNSKSFPFPDTLDKLGEVEGVRLQVPEENSKKTRILDAIIDFSKGSIAIESKVDSSIDIRQLKEEFNNLKKLQPNMYLFLFARNAAITEKLKQLEDVRFKYKNQIDWLSWSDIYKNIETYIASDNEEDFLAFQFIEYLELSGMVEQFVKRDFDSIYEGDVVAVKDKLGNFLKYLVKKPGLPGKFCVHSSQKRNTKTQLRERVIWDSVYESSLGDKLNEFPHITFDMDEKSLCITLAVEGKTTPHSLVSGMRDEEEMFVKQLVGMEKPSRSWKNADNPLFVVQYWTSRNYGQSGSEDVFFTIIPLYELVTTNGKRYKKGKKKESYHAESIRLRKEKLEQIFEELDAGKSNTPYSYFRVGLQIPKSSLLDKESLDEQVDFIYKKVEPLFKCYKDWKKWWYGAKSK